MKKLTLFLAVFSVSFCLSAGRSFAATTTSVAPEAKPFSSYIDFGFGGLIGMSNKAAQGKNSRFAIQFEPGSKTFAFPVSLSFGQNAFNVSGKPRFQYFFAPVSSLPNLFVAPGVGLVINYFKVADAFVGTDHTIELGVQISANVQYRIGSMFNVMLTPVAMDLDFWRKFFVDAGAASASGSSSKLGMVYGIMASAGLNF
jgi:hypothetical protein